MIRMRPTDMIRRTILVLLTLCALATAVLWYYCWPLDHPPGYDGFGWGGQGVDLPWGVRCSIPKSHLSKRDSEGSSTHYTIRYWGGSSAGGPGRLVRVGYQIQCTVPLGHERAFRWIVEQRRAVLAYCWPAPGGFSLPGRSWGVGRGQLVRGPAPHLGVPHAPSMPPGVGFPDPTVEWGAISVQAPLWLLFVISLSYPILAFVRGPVRRWLRKHRGLCVKCGYDLTGNVSAVCPECGTGILPGELARITHRGAHKARGEGEARQDSY